MAACGACGFDPSTVSPPDAIVTIRSLPRRYRTALGSVPHDDRRERVLMANPEGHPYSPVGLVDDVARSLGAHGAAFGERLDVRESTSSDGALAQLEAVASSLAGALEEVKGEAWLDDVAGERAQDRARDAAHAGTHPLRELPALVDAAIRAQS